MVFRPANSIFQKEFTGLSQGRSGAPGGCGQKAHPGLRLWMVAYAVLGQQSYVLPLDADESEPYSSDHSQCRLTPPITGWEG